MEVIELRRYTLHPGTRETLIELFERELIEPQEAVGMHVLAQFRDLEDPDSFVWLRGFDDMSTRAAALAAFYGGPVWREHRDAANRTMIDSDDVLLLRPAGPAGALAAASRPRPVVGAEDSSSPPFRLTTYHLPDGTADEFAGFFAGVVEPVLREAGVTVVASYRGEHRPNDFPALPVREGEEVFVWLAARHRVALERLPAWRDDVARQLHDRLERPPEVALLEATSRSLLGGG